MVVAVAASVESTAAAAGAWALHREPPAGESAAVASVTAALEVRQVVLRAMVGRSVATAEAELLAALAGWAAREEVLQVVRKEEGPQVARVARPLAQRWAQT